MGQKGRSVIGALALVCMTIGASDVFAVGFRPFSSVADVCPSCPKRASDELTLTDDSKVRAKVVAENDDFFVLSRYSEVRALPKTSVQSVEWANDSAPCGAVVTRSDRAQDWAHPHWLDHRGERGACCLSHAVLGQ